MIAWKGEGETMNDLTSDALLALALKLTHNCTVATTLANGGEMIGETVDGVAQDWFELTNEFKRRDEENVDLRAKLAAAEVRIAELDALLGFLGTAGMRIESGNRWLVLRDGVYTVRKVAGVELVVVHEGDNLAGALRSPVALRYRNNKRAHPSSRTKVRSSQATQYAISELYVYISGYNHFSLLARCRCRFAVRRRQF